jgi:heme/copper-type cytochrome/quinol oxidase subunit 2
MLRVTFLAAPLLVPILFADAPNPADCPHHQCNYHPATAGGIAVALVVVIVVVVLLVLLTLALLHRRRRRRRRRRRAAGAEG